MSHGEWSRFRHIYVTSYAFCILLSSHVIFPHFLCLSEYVTGKQKLKSYLTITLKILLLIYRGRGWTFFWGGGGRWWIAPDVYQVFLKGPVFCASSVLAVRRGCTATAVQLQPSNAHWSWVFLQLYHQHRLELELDNAAGERKPNFWQGECSSCFYGRWILWKW